MDITVREVHESDKLEILSLINNELGYPDVTLEELSLKMKKIKLQGNYFIFVAVISNRIVGFVGVVQEMALEIHKDYFRIKEMAVSKAYQNKGVGGYLLRHIEDLASERGIELFVLSSSFHRIDAHRFYERNGYTKTSFTFFKEIKK